MKKGTAENILAFLEANPSVYIAADLERMTFLNRRGNKSSPKSIRNRLQDLARDKMISVEEKDGFAYYSAKPQEVKPPQEYYVKHPITGQRISTRELALL